MGIRDSVLKAPSESLRPEGAYAIARSGVIGILYESDEWSDWKLGRELEAALAELSLIHI